MFMRCEMFMSKSEVPEPRGTIECGSNYDRSFEVFEATLINM